jgi:hypothetical protein
MNLVASTSSIIQYTDSEAQESLSKKGQIVSAGAKMSRLKIGDDSRFYVAARVIGQHHNWFTYLYNHLRKATGRYVEIKNGEDIVLLNVRSFAKRLHVKKADIYKSAKNGELMTLFNRQAQGAQSTISGYEKIVNKYGDESKTGHNSKTLMKIIRTAVLTEQHNYSQFKISTEQETLYLGFDNKRKEIELAVLGDVFADGSYGEIRKFTSVFDGHVEVFKQAKLIAGDFAKNDVNNEHLQLNDVHADGNVWGVQEAPRKVVEITDDSSTTQFGYIGTKYQRDYSKQIAMKPPVFSEHLFEMHQLLFGLKELANRNILHGDIKPANILIKQDFDGTNLAHIADLGGAKVAKSSTPISELPGDCRTVTSTFSPFADLLLANHLADQGKFAELVDVEKKRDVFSMGMTLYFALSQKYPYPINYQGFPIVNVGYTPIAGKNIPKEIQALIKSMLHPDYTKRPSAQEAFDRYDAFLKANYPELRERIQEKIKKYYPGSKVS